MLDLSTFWDLPRGTVAQLMDHGGYNNKLSRVDAGNEHFVLRVYGNHANPKFIQHELSVLMGLNQQLKKQSPPPFQVPVPVITKRGELWTLAVDSQTGARQLMVLIPFISGQNPTPGNTPDQLAQTTAAGKGLATLLLALSKVNVQGIASPPPYNELGRIHPLVPDPLEALGSLGTLVPRHKRNRLQAVIEEVVDEAEQYFKQLPRQLVHGDFITGNILMDGTQVTGILDFENCAVNPRVMDVAIALDMWSWDALGSGQEWPRIEAMCRGVAQVLKLHDEEIEAIPTLILLRNASVLMHVIGRFTGNLSPYVDVEMWLDAMLNIDAWLSLYRKRFVDCMSMAMSA